MLILSPKEMKYPFPQKLFFVIVLLIVLLSVTTVLLNLIIWWNTGIDFYILDKYWLVGSRIGTLQSDSHLVIDVDPLPAPEANSGPSTVICDDTLPLSIIKDQIIK